MTMVPRAVSLDAVQSQTIDGVSQGFLIHHDMLCLATCCYLETMGDGCVVVLCHRMYRRCCCVIVIVDVDFRGETI